MKPAPAETLLGEGLGRPSVASAIPAREVRDGPRSHRAHRDHRGRAWQPRVFGGAGSPEIRVGSGGLANLYVMDMATARVPAMRSLRPAGGDRRACQPSRGRRRRAAYGVVDGTRAPVDPLVPTPSTVERFARPRPRCAGRKLNHDRRQSQPFSPSGCARSARIADGGPAHGLLFECGASFRTDRRRRLAAAARRGRPCHGP